MCYIYDLYLNDYYFRATDLCSGNNVDVCLAVYTNIHVWNVLLVLERLHSAVLAKCNTRIFLFLQVGFF